MLLPRLYIKCMNELPSWKSIGKECAMWWKFHELWQCYNPVNKGMNLKTCSNEITGDIIQLPVPQRRYSVDHSYNEHTSSLMIQGWIERLKYSLEPLNEEIWSVIDIQISQSTTGGCYNTQFPMFRFVYSDSSVTKCSISVDLSKKNIFLP